jgi:hypothetical protein
VRRANEQVIPEDILRRVPELTTRVAELTDRLDLYESARAAGNGRLDQQTAPVVRDAEDSSDPIEFITENGFVIVRPWESGRWPTPAVGTCRFAVTDGFIEREVTVEISRDVVSEISLRTRSRVQLSSSFWICCAERHLANYVTAHADFPEEDKLVVEKLDREDIVLAVRWNRSDE